MRVPRWPPRVPRSPLASGFRKELQCRRRESMHVVEPVALARAQANRLLGGSGNRDPGMAGRVAVAVPGGPGGTGLADPPGGPEPLARQPRPDQGVLLRGRAVTLQQAFFEVPERLPALARV